ncbi:MAG: hypothetical protein WBF58_06915 [Xanthobacteraceae bacterium]
MAMPAADECDEPVTLHGVMATMIAQGSRIAQGLQTHFQPQQKLSHELFVLLLQLKEAERTRQRRGSPR